MNRMKHGLVVVSMVALALLAGVALGHVYRKHAMPDSEVFSVERGDYQAYFRQGESLLLYTRATCEHCASARRLLARQGTPYVERPIEQSVHRAEVDRLGASQVPVLLTRTHKTEGFDADRIVELVRTGRID